MGMGRTVYHEDDIRKNLSESGAELISIHYRDNTNYRVVTYSDKNGYIYQLSINHIFNKKNRFFVSKHNPHSIDNIRRWLTVNNKSLIILDDVYKGGHAKHTFRCTNPECGHIFETVINYVLYDNTGCPACCESKGEKRIRAYLTKNNIKFVSQKSFDRLTGINGGALSFDFFIPTHNLLIEYQGEFHDGKGNAYVRARSKKVKQHDMIKKKFVKKNDIKFKEIWYQDFDRIEEILDDYYLHGIL